MGQAGDVAHDIIAADVLAHGKGHRGRVAGELTGLDDIPDAHGGDGAVGHLDAHHGDLVGHRRHADAAGAQRQRDIVGQVGDLAELDALLQRELVASDAGAVDNVAGGGVHAEGAQGLRQTAGVIAQLRAHLGAVIGAVLLQQGDGRVAVGLLALRQLLLDGLSHLLGGGLHLLLELGLLFLAGHRLLCRGRLLRRRSSGGRRGIGLRQHLIRRPDGGGPAGEEVLLRAALHGGGLAVQRDIEIGPLPAGLVPRRLLRGGRLLPPGQRLKAVIQQIVPVVLVLPAAAAVLSDLVHRLLGRHVQRAQQRRQQQHHENDDGHHLAQQRLAAQRQTAGHHAAAGQGLSARPQTGQQAAAQLIRSAAEDQMPQHTRQQRHQQRTGGAQDHGTALMPQLDDRRAQQRRGGQIEAPAQQALEHPGDKRQQQRVYIEIAHQHAQRQQQADDAPHQTRRAVIGGRLRSGRGLFPFRCFLSCRCHSFPHLSHLTACSTNVRMPTAQQ